MKHNASLSVMRNTVDNATTVSNSPIIDNSNLADRETRNFNRSIEIGVPLPDYNPFEFVGALGFDGSFHRYTRKRSDG